MIDHFRIDVLKLDVVREEEISNFVCPGAGVEVEESSIGEEYVQCQLRILM